jgi:lauroyl/myristoyl acyltransferase
MVSASLASSADARAGTGGPVPRAHWLNRAPLYRLAAGVAATMPRRVRLSLAAALGRAAARACPGESRVVRENLARVAPGLTPAARARQVRELFAHFAMCFADLITTNRAGADVERLVGAGEGIEHVDAVLGAGGGFVVLTAHVGNWELAGRALAARGAGRPVHIVMAPEADPAVERLLRHRGAPLRFVTLRTPAEAVPLVAALRRGEIVGMQGDRALGHRGDVAVEFFGAPARFPLGPFLLARAAGVPVVAAFCVLRPDRRYAVHVLPPRRVERGAEEDALRCWVDGLAGIIERAPTQWFNFVDTWGTAGAR